MWVKLLWGLMGLSGGLLSVTGFVIFVLRKRKPRPITKPATVVDALEESEPAVAFSS
jgi:hypothetical protein